MNNQTNTNIISIVQNHYRREFTISVFAPIEDVHKTFIIYFLKKVIMKIYTLFCLVFVSSLSGVIFKIPANADERSMPKECFDPQGIVLPQCALESRERRNSITGEIEEELDKLLVRDNTINNLQLERAKEAAYICFNKTMLSYFLSGSDRNSI
jgi:hypothetical protein